MICAKRYLLLLLVFFMMSHASSSAPPKPVKVAILGASGGIGQPLSLLCKLNPQIDELSLYDLVNTPGVAADLSHIPSHAKVFGINASKNTPPGENKKLQKALQNATLVVILSGVPRKPGMSRDDLFNINAGIVSTLVEGCAMYCPHAFIAIVTNPVNSMVPLASEVLKRHGVYDRRKVAGVTTLDVARASAFLRDAMVTVGDGKNNDSTENVDLMVDVIGGHSGTTILPLFSRAISKEDACLSREVLHDLTVRTQFGGDEIVKAKEGTGSATLSMAWAAYQFIENTLLALAGGDERVIQCAYVESNLTEQAFFSSPCRFGVNGVEEILPLGKLSDYEAAVLEAMGPVLSAQIQKGKLFGRGNVKSRL